MNKLGMVAIFGAGSFVGAVTGTAIGVPLVVRALQAEEVKARKFVVLNEDDEPMGHIDAGGFSFDGPEGKEAFYFRNADRPYLSFRRNEKTAVTLGCIGENDGLMTYRDDSPRIMIYSAKNYANGIFSMNSKPLELNELDSPSFENTSFAFIHADEDTSDIIVEDKTGKEAVLKPAAITNK